MSKDWVMILTRRVCHGRRVLRLHWSFPTIFHQFYNSISNVVFRINFLLEFKSTFHLLITWQVTDIQTQKQTFTFDEDVNHQQRICKGFTFQGPVNCHFLGSCTFRLAIFVRNSILLFHKNNLYHYTKRKTFFLNNTFAN